MRDIFSIAGKTALVTGGSRGIGEMIAGGFLAHGAKVYISSRKADACEATAARLVDEFGGECIALPGDVGTMAGVTALASALAARESRLDILVNNAGTAWGAPLDTFPESGWDKVMATNVKGVFFLTQQLLPLLRASATHEGSGPGDQHRVGGRDQDADLRQLLVRAVEGGRPSPDAGARGPPGEGEHHRQRDSRRGRSPAGC